VRAFKSGAGPDDPHPMRLVALALLGVAVLALSGAARAEIYSCRGPDGNTIYSSDPAACPGTLPHAPSREVQRLGGSSGGEEGAQPPGAQAGPREAVPESEDAQAAMWKRKRLDAEAEVKEIDRGIGEFKEIVTWCNRGGDLAIEDKVGVREDYSCEEAQATYDKMARRQKELHQYLSGGLEDECRRAGCLPGWIR
jgi:Domain of unknown function (DUF4124)